MKMSLRVMERAEKLEEKQNKGGKLNRKERRFLATIQEIRSSSNA